jgi:hypothetical protein
MAVKKCLGKTKKNLNEAKNRIFSLYLSHNLSKQGKLYVLQYMA